MESVISNAPSMNNETSLRKANGVGASVIVIRVILIIVAEREHRLWCAIDFARKESACVANLV